ncbi:cytochrome c2 [Chryseobacterium sp. SLBN-27]|nr:cytochrome c2 [Chryseobacterium sp. SLBN-27]
MISWRKHYRQTLIAIGLLLSTSASIYGQDGDPKNGEKLFKANCTACHALDKQVVGPALKGVVARLETEQGLGKDWLHKWIKNNKELRASGDKYANEVFEKFNKTEMQVFPNLTDKDIDDILAYTTNPPAPEPVKTDATKDTANAGSRKWSTTKLYHYKRSNYFTSSDCRFIGLDSIETKTISETRTV